MTFDDLSQVTVLLERQGRVSYRALKRRYGLSDEDREDVKAELIDARRLATDEDGRVLVLRASSPSGEPPDAVDQTDPTTGGIPDGDVKPTADETERRQITVMFCDLADSTSLSGRLDPQDLCDLIRAYQQAAGAVILGFDGSPSTSATLWAGAMTSTSRSTGDRVSASPSGLRVLLGSR